MKHSSLWQEEVLNISCSGMHNRISRILLCRLELGHLFGLKLSARFYFNHKYEDIRLSYTIFGISVLWSEQMF